MNGQEPRYLNNRNNADEPAQRVFGENETVYANGKDAYRPSVTPTVPQPPSGGSKGLIIAFSFVIAVLVLALVILVMVLFIGGRDKDDDSESSAKKKNTAQTFAEEEIADSFDSSEELPVIEDTEPAETRPPDETQAPTETTSTTDAATKATTKTTTKATTKKGATEPRKPEDAVKNDYEVFEEELLIRVDEVGSLPLRSAPDRYNSEVLLYIPDGIIIRTLGYKDTGSEVWFRLEYSGTKGWARGGMMQPPNMGELYDSKYDKPGLEKWRNKFELQVPPATDAAKSYAYFKGTLYYIPDLSSGVQVRYSSTTEVIAIYYQNGFYYCTVTADGRTGWIHESQLDI